ncbi:caspase-6-like [Anopheles bellator]|uniref:caspase-6-like n=1 Tax=Anopheles bellator TaxID=139047 RepID=UPI00264978AA|nr:caspase-6-like [Anopheles bellator]
MDPDRTDSRPLSKSSGSSAASVTEHPVTTSPADEFEYKMDHQYRGVALVTNHTTFDRQLGVPSRDGSAEDRDAICGALRRLRFEVLVFDDLSKGELFKELQLVANRDHRHNDCLVVVVLTHGGNGKLYASDGAYEAERLWKLFVGDACPTLIGKPKLLFIQTCRGNPRTDAAATRKRRVPDAIDSRESTATHQYTIPTMADLLVGYSTYDSQDSWLSPLAGSHYLRSLATNLYKYGHSMDLPNLLALVAKDVACGDREGPKQIPYSVSTLTKDLYFPLR